ncbi:DDE-type integrase/transposase/recombinase [Sphaerisporangium fuscum]|uniref:DDE-type integrase/transposase/recombinase n=1 Tax=Sphaerisporangium fuscum TaxID=2835868 RepID=UPI001BDCB362|nr:DDE-type integrase/transposase/recombinase [Sphaerisporangium fuscum]
MADHYRTKLIKDTIRMGAGTGLVQPGAVFHSDRGSNHTSNEFGRFLTGRRIRRSVGRTGVYYDNAMAESSFSTIKNEWHHRFGFTSRAKAKRQVIRYIEGSAAGGACTRRSATGHSLTCSTSPFHPKQPRRLRHKAAVRNHRGSSKP